VSGISKEELAGVLISQTTPKSTCSSVRSSKEAGMIWEDGPTWLDIVEGCVRAIMRF